MSNRRRPAVGRYRDRATVQKLKAAATKDPLGPVKRETAANWETYETIYVEEDATGAKSVDTGHGSAEVAYMLRTPYSTEAAAILPTYRLLMEDGRILNVVAAYPDGNSRREVIIEATQTV